MSKTNLPLFVLYKPYSKRGFKQIAKLEGIVQGVVVQMINLVSVSNKPLPSFTLKAT